jgi:hypothetical protein
LSARVRDSLLAAVLADTLDEVLATEELRLQPAPWLRQSFTVRPTLRRYSVAGVAASEQAAPASWLFRFRRATMRLDATPIAYRADTGSASMPTSAVVGGMSPISARLDLRILRADTLRVFVQTASFPGALTAQDASALAAIGTSTIDLDAASLGVSARTGVRYAHTRAIGENGVSLTLRGGLEYDPKPSGTATVSWRGTTLRGGLGVSRQLDDLNFGAFVEVTRSFADSLGGRNLFPGGGSLLAEARALRFFGAESEHFGTVNVFYTKPLGIERPDQPTRLIPVGDFAGVTGSLAMTLGRATLLPVVTLLRESSSATATVDGRPTRLAASGFASSASVGVALPLGSVITITPEVGAALGSVGQTVTSSFPRRIGRPITRSQAFSDPVRGAWATIEVSLSR